MENATKALMIAAAILVAVLVITLGINIYTNSAEQAEGAGDLSEYQVQQFNDKFRKFEGTSVSGADVNALLTAVFNHNNQQPDTTTCVAVSGKTTIAATNKITKSPAKVPTAGRYKVELTYSPTTKLVTTIAISEVK